MSAAALAPAGVALGARSGMTGIVPHRLGHRGVDHGGPLCAQAVRGVRGSPGSNASLVLAESTEIIPASLALASGHLYWMDGAVARSATIR